MAELVLKIEDAAGYEDGDVLCAFNTRRISQVHLEHICSPKLRPDLSPRRGDPTFGFLQRGTLVEELRSRMFRYRFERVSRTAITRTDLVTDEQVTIDNTPRLIDGRLQHMDVDLFVRRRLAVENHWIFRSEARATWYGKARPIRKPALNAVWDRVEADTKMLRSSHRKFPLTDGERAKFLPIAHEDFDDDKAAEFTAPLMNEDDPDNPVMEKKRANRIDYTAIFPTRLANIWDKSLIEDLRDEVERTTADMTKKQRRRA